MASTADDMEWILFIDALIRAGGAIPVRHDTCSGRKTITCDDSCYGCRREMEWKALVGRDE